jgi:hypothetical protein
MCELGTWGISVGYGKGAGRDNGLQGLQTSTLDKGDSLLGCGIVAPLIYFYKTTQHHIPEGYHFHTCHCENLKSLQPTANDSVPGPVFSDEVVFALPEMACREGQVCRSALTTIHI